MSEQIQLIEVLSSEEIDLIEAEIAHLPDRQSAAIEALRIVQSKRGWVSDESLRAIAAQLEMSAEALDSIATFYNLIFRQPVGRHVIMLCDSVSCFVMGSEEVRTRVCEHLGVGVGETTADGKYTLLPVVCLGACDRAPVMTVDETLVTHLSIDSVGTTLDEFD